MPEVELSEPDTSQIKSWRPIVTLIVFTITNTVVKILRKPEVPMDQVSMAQNVPLDAAVVDNDDVVIDMGETNELLDPPDERPRWVARLRAKKERLKWLFRDCMMLEYLSPVLAFMSSFAVIAFSKFAEEEKGKWEWVFAGCYILWAVSVTTSLYFDWLRSRTRLLNSLCHTGCCAIVLYFFASILSVKTPTTILPICINLGLVASLGIQKISPAAKDRIFGWMSSCLGTPYTSQREGMAV